MSPEDQKRVVGVDKLSTSYQMKKQSLKTNLRLNSLHIIKMSEEKDDLKSIKVYKFNNTKENWHEFGLKFRVIIDSRGYYRIIDGSMSPPNKQETITVSTGDKGDVLKVKKDKLKARAANMLGYRDLVMSTEGISLNIEENATSEELTKRGLEKGLGKT